MKAELDRWQARLAAHFTELRRNRSSPLDAPIFALEHGLDASEVQALALAVRAHIAHAPPCNDHALAWIVYSTELGYRYSGDEYWQTFEQETPWWTVHGDRYLVRDYYRSFQQTFGGAKPSGPWADHFSIICWPITHAILPRDLQRQLARILYELRHSFSAELFESPSMLGELISSRSWSGTSRFQNLAQEPQLVGQIAAALLLQGEFGTASLVYPATLTRIADDLDRERRAREWLRSARRFAKERAQVRGFASLRKIARSTIGSPDDARIELASLGIEPRLILRPIDAYAESWGVTLEVPDLSHLLVRFPHTREILAGSRCVVAGSTGRPLPRGICLHGSKQVSLGRWPRDDEVLLKFEQENAYLEYLLRTECLLRPGPTWLFRIASDGLAYELRSLRVRAGESYVMLSAAAPITSSDIARAVDVRCEGVHGALIEVPTALTPEWEEALRRLGLTQAKTIEVWPAGLAAVAWDGEGRGEWLASEQPCLAVQTDHPVAALVVAIGTQPVDSIELNAVVPGTPIFVELPPLAVGLHNVQLSIRDTDAAESQPLGELNVVIRIMDARPWSPGVSPHGPLLMQMDPAAPTIEQFWEGRVGLTLQGPPGRQLKTKVSLFDRQEDSATYVHHLPLTPLPLTADHWRQHFEKHCRNTSGAQAAYDAARICEVEFRAEELGALTVRCEREFAPLRWLVRRDGKAYAVRLLNDSGDSARPHVGYMAFETPSVQVILAACSDYGVPAAGGLYFASVGQFRAAVIAPPSISGLQDLCCKPRIDPQERSTESVLRAIETVRLWGDARLPGDLISAKRQRDVLDAFSRYILQLIGGEHWTRAEVAVREQHAELGRLVDAVSRRREEVSIGVILQRDSGELAAASRQDRISRLASLAARYLCLAPRSAAKVSPGEEMDRASAPIGPGSLEWLAELALRLASVPGTVETWAGAHLRAGVTRLLDELPTLARAARLLVLSTDRSLQSNVALGEVYAGWRWE